MMFEGENALKKVSVLSGGEKSRVMLGKLLVTPVNLLLLDEPTNHLDMESCDALLAALDNFDGAVVMVTHNEMFLHLLAHRLVVFQSDDIEVFEGSYQRFLDQGGWQEEELSITNASSGETTAKKTDKISKKAMRRQRSKRLAERSRILRPLEQTIAKIENDIDANEKTLDNLTQDMQSATAEGNGTRIADLSQAIHACQSAIDQLFDELEVHTANYEKQKRGFDENSEVGNI